MLDKAAKKKRPVFICKKCKKRLTKSIIGICTYCRLTKCTDCERRTFSKHGLCYICTTRGKAERADAVRKSNPDYYKKIEMFKEFIRIWAESKDMKEVVERTGLQQAIASNKATHLRRRGVHLKKMPNGRSGMSKYQIMTFSDYRELQDFAIRVDAEMEAKRIKDKVKNHGY